jgi:hypothetical protein
MGRVLVFLLLGLLAGASAAGLQPASSGGKADPRLGHKVTLRLKRSPLSDVVAELGRQAGVKMTAAADVADEPAIVFATEQPASEVMRQIASLFGYRWARSGEPAHYRYELYQDRKSKEAEEALRERDRMRAVDKLRDNLRAAPQGARLRAQSSEPGVPPRQPDLPICSRVAALLKAEHWQAMLRGRTVVLSAPPQRGALPLPPELAQELLQRSRPLVLSPQNAPPPAGGEEAAPVQQVQLQIWLDTRLEPYEARAVFTARPILLPRPEDPLRARIVVPVTASGIHQQPRPKALSPAEAMALWGSDPVLGMRRLLAIERPKPRFPSRAAIQYPYVRISDALPAIAQTFGVNLVADAYRSWVVSVPPAPQEMALYEALDRYVLPGSRWEKQGEFIRARSHTWYIDRLADIPDRVVQTWAAEFRQRRGLTLTAATNLVLTLRDEQLQRFEDAMREEGVFLDMFSLNVLMMGSKEFLRAYGCLSPGQQRRLLAGEPVPANDMPAAARHWLAAALEVRRREGRDLSPADADRPGALILSLNQLRREVVSGDESAVGYRWFLMDGPNAGAATSGGTTSFDTVPPGFSEGGQVAQQVSFRYQTGEKASTRVTLLLPLAYVEAPESEPAPKREDSHPEESR